MPDTQYTLRILALDDDPDDLAILRHHLHGMPDVKVDLVLQTEPGRALGIACESAFDLVFLDYQLGSCLGLQFFQQLRAQGITTPVIMITDQGDEELAVTALHAGISDYLSKGLLSTRSLTRAVTNTIDKHRMAMALIKSREELERADFAPFRANADLPLAMTAHVVFTALDPARPATLSPVVVSQIIRGHIGFDGLLMSDDLSMKALSRSFRERTEALFAAGVDMALHCNGDLAEAEEVAAAAPELAGKSAERALKALARIAGDRVAFDPVDSRAKLDAALATQT